MRHAIIISLLIQILFATACTKEQSFTHKLDISAILGEYEIEKYGYVFDSVAYGAYFFPQDNYNEVSESENLRNITLTIGENAQGNGYYMSFDSIFCRDTVFLNMILYFDLEQYEGDRFFQEAYVHYHPNQDYIEMLLHNEWNSGSFIRLYDVNAPGIRLVIGFQRLRTEKGTISSFNFDYSAE